MTRLDDIRKHAERVNGSKDYEWVYERAQYWLVPHIYELLSLIDTKEGIIQGLLENVERCIERHDESLKEIDTKDKQLAEAFVKWLGECPTCGVQPDLDDGKLDHWGKCKYNDWLQEQRKAENIN